MGQRGINRYLQDERWGRMVREEILVRKDIAWLIENNRLTDQPDKMKFEM